MLDTARAIRIHANLPIKFWGDCILTATYLINLMPSSVLNWKIPYELLMNKPASYDHLRVIGCLCFAAIHSSDKFASRARRCVLIGYPYAQKGYKLYDLDSHQIFLSRDVLFRENCFPFKQSSTGSPNNSVPAVNPILLEDDFLQLDSISPANSSEFGSASPINSSEPPINSSEPLTSSDSVPASVPASVRRSSRVSQIPKKFD